MRGGGGRVGEEGDVDVRIVGHVFCAGQAGVSHFFMFAIRVGSWKETVCRVPAWAPAYVFVDSCWQGDGGVGWAPRFRRGRRVRKGGETGEERRGKPHWTNTVRVRKLTRAFARPRPRGGGRTKGKSALDLYGQVNLVLREGFLYLSAGRIIRRRQGQARFANIKADHVQHVLDGDRVRHHKQGVD